MMIMLKIYEAIYLNQDTPLFLNEKTEQPEYVINGLDQNNFQYVLFPYKEGLKFYLISDYEVNDTIVFGKNFLFYWDVLGTIILHKVSHLKPLRIPVKNHVGNPKESFIIKYGKENPFI